MRSLLEALPQLQCQRTVALLPRKWREPACHTSAVSTASSNCGHLQQEGVQGTVMAEARHDIAVGRHHTLVFVCG